MIETILPCFNDCQVEGAIIGRLLAGYGELELELCQCVAATMTGRSAIDDAIKAMFRERRGEKRRIDVADNLSRSSYVDAKLGKPFSAAIANMHRCRVIRNQYAHCHWYGKESGGVAFVNLEDLSSREEIGQLEHARIFVSLALLREQEAFFVYLKRCFWFLVEQRRAANLKPGERRPNPLFSLPPAMVEPPLHN